MKLDKKYSFYLNYSIQGLPKPSRQRNKNRQILLKFIPTNKMF